MFTRVHFTKVTCGYTYMYLPRLISVFTQLFSWETLEGIQSQLDFRFQLKLLLSRTKINNNNNNNHNHNHNHNNHNNHNKSITQMVQVEFLTFQNQVFNKRGNALQKKKYKKYKKKKYKRLLKLSGCVSRRF